MPGHFVVGGRYRAGGCVDGVEGVVVERVAYLESQSDCAFPSPVQYHGLLCSFFRVQKQPICVGVGQYSGVGQFPSKDMEDDDDERQPGGEAPFGGSVTYVWTPWRVSSQPRGLP